MKKETAIRIAALFDGEADSAEQADLRALLESDPDAKAYWNSLQSLSDNLQGAHVSHADAGAHWNNLRQRLDQPAPVETEKVLYFPKFSAAAAALVALGIAIWFPGRKMDSPADLDVAGLDAAVYMVETDLENASPVVYIDEPSGWTVVWVVEQDIQDPVDG